MIADSRTTGRRPGRFVAACRRASFFAVVLAALIAARPGAQSVRDRTRPRPEHSTQVTERQADELTLTLTDVSVRALQVWVRTAGPIDPARKVVTASISPAEAALVSIGQRVRAFPPESKSSIYQARITSVRPRGNRVAVAATLTGPGHQTATHYVLEIVTEAGRFLSVPNEALIVTEDGHRVYVQEGGEYIPRDVEVGLQGELYTQVLGGVEPGAHVVTVGSFFIDADHRLKAF